MAAVMFEVRAFPHLTKFLVQAPEQRRLGKKVICRLFFLFLHGPLGVGQDLVGY